MFEEKGCISSMLDGSELSRTYNQDEIYNFGQFENLVLSQTTAIIFFNFFSLLYWHNCYAA